MKNKLLLSMMLYVHCCYASEDRLEKYPLEYRLDDPMERAIYNDNLEMVFQELRRSISLEEQERYVRLVKNKWSIARDYRYSAGRNITAIYRLLINANIHRPGGVKLPMNPPVPIIK